MKIDPDFVGNYGMSWAGGITMRLAYSTQNYSGRCEKPEKPLTEKLIVVP
jgi:hypothetical protein